MTESTDQSSWGQPTPCKIYWPFWDWSADHRKLSEILFVHDKGLFHWHFCSLWKKTTTTSPASTGVSLYNKSRVIKQEYKFSPSFWKSKNKFSFKNNSWRNHATDTDIQGYYQLLQVPSRLFQVPYRGQTRCKHCNFLKPFGISKSAKKFWMTLLSRWTPLHAPSDLTNNHSSSKSATRVSVVSNYLPLCKNVNFMLCKHISLWKTSLPIKIAFDSLMTIFCSKWLKHPSVGSNICSPLRTAEDRPRWQVYRWITYSDL